MQYENSVLFVDDQNDLLLLIDKRMKNEAYNKYYANSTLEALEIMKNNDIDVIVTDMIMPDISGLKLLESVKEQYPNVVKIVLSGHSQIPSILEAINRGDIHRYITKPWRITEEGKQIIRDAIDYSNLIKRTEKNKSISINNITPKDLTNLLDNLNVSYLVMKDDKVIKVSDVLEIDLNSDSTDENTLLRLKNNGFQHLKINNSLSGYFKKTV